MESNGLHDHGHLMVTIRALAQDIQGQVDFGFSFYFQQGNPSYLSNIL